ncbi:MAG TPA: acyltransferase [Gemmatimonadaceae bacterium]|nr:acyltransferase [Gemmatimonadaceae bacterium]
MLTPSAAHRTTLPERNLDVTRAVAVSCVLANHVGLLLDPGTALLRFFTQLGEAGVMIFFVHTSLVLMASLERQGTERHWVRTFYTRRAFRIYPLAMATVLLVVVAAVPRAIPVIGVHAVATSHPPVQIAANLALVQNLLGIDDVLGPLWTLPVEVDMYLLLPFCFLVARRGSRDMLLLFAALVVAHVVVATQAVSSAWRFNVLYFAPCFFGGVLAYHLLRTRARPIAPAWMLALALAATIALRPLMPAGFLPDAVRWFPCILLGVTLPFVAELAPSMLTRAAHIVATYSYGVYLLHMPVFWLAFDVCRSLPMAAQIVIAIAGVVILPWAAYHLIEAPGIRLGRGIVHRPLTFAATQPAP